MATVTFKTILVNSYDMDGPLDDLIAELNAARIEGMKMGLNNIRVDTDWEYAEFGSEQYWRVNICGDKE